MGNIFVSHAVADKELVDAFVDFLQIGCGVKAQHIFCSSLDGMSIPEGNASIPFIEKTLREAAMVIMIITPSYYESKFCLCETGAAWILGHNNFPLLVPPFDWSDLKAVLNPMQGGMINDPSVLANLRDRLFGIQESTIGTAGFNAKKDAFIEKLKSLNTQGKTSVSGKEHDERKPKFCETAKLQSETPSSQTNRGPISEFVDTANVHNAPFMFARALKLYQELKKTSQQQADAALEVFLDQVRSLSTVGCLAQNVRKCIFSGPADSAVDHRSVWAVCGRKDESTAATLYGACENAFNGGGHIQRVFFPPDSVDDQKDILDAIGRHLKTRMTVLAFTSRATAMDALYEFHLPRGFGMTWIGTGDRQVKTGSWAAMREPDNERDPDASVFVHWGGLHGADHPGMIIRGNADWSKYLFELFRGIQGKTVVANADKKGMNKLMTLNEFLTQFPHYELGRLSPQRKPTP